MFELVISVVISIIALTILLMLIFPFWLIKLGLTVIFILFCIATVKWLIEMEKSRPKPKEPSLEELMFPDYGDDPDEGLYDGWDDDTPTKRGPGRPRKGS